MERLMNTAEGKRIVDRYGEQIEIAASEWYGEFSLPERLYVAKAGTDVVGIQKREGLSFTEEFWLDNVPVVLKFALLLENSEGDVLYYGMIPEQITNNIWKMEAKDSYREDKKGNRYEIHGGEVAVIYPGDGSEIGKTSYGIY